MKTISRFAPLFQVLIATLCGYAVHKLACIFLLDGNGADICGSLEFLYGVFLLFSLAIIFILMKVKKHAIDSTGYAFLLLTCVKMVFAYAVFTRLLNSAEQFIESDKLHLFAIFAFFLTIETVVTAGILNSVKKT